MYQISDKIITFLPWEEIEIEAQQQILNTANLPFIFHHVAVMPDCHFGKGATIGTVIATKGAIVPAAVGVDIGCGMIAVKTSLKKEDLKDLKSIREGIERRIPMSAGKFNQKITDSAQNRIDELKEDYHKFDKNWEFSLGTLGGGNHFIEICVDMENTIWLTLHSGSRGVGNKIGNHYIKIAQELCNKFLISLPDKDLAYLPENTEEFNSYIKDLKWAQEFARHNRDEMMDRILTEISYQVYGENGHQQEIEVERINSHHNFTQIENHCSTCIDNLHNDNHLYERLLADGVVSKFPDFLFGYRPFVHSCGGLLLLGATSVLKVSPLQADVLEQTHDVLRSLFPELGQKHNHLHQSFCQCGDASLGQIDEAYCTSLNKFGLSFCRLFGVEKESDKLDRVLDHIFLGHEAYTINHNTNKHLHKTSDVWITRKGAIKAELGMKAMIPGSMGTKSYIVSGLANRMSFNSSPHGAGRRMSRKKASQQFTMQDLERTMEGIEFRKSDVLIDEIPMAYKDIDSVIEHSKELLKVNYILKQIINCKGD